jgi:hypothetical protein
MIHNVSRGLDNPGLTPTYWTKVQYTALKRLGRTLREQGLMAGAGIQGSKITKIGK